MEADRRIHRLDLRGARGRLPHDVRDTRRPGSEYREPLHPPRVPMPVDDVNRARGATSGDRLEPLDIPRGHRALASSRPVRSRRRQWRPGPQIHPTRAALLPWLVLGHREPSPYRRLPLAIVHGRTNDAPAGIQARPSCKQVTTHPLLLQDCDPGGDHRPRVGGVPPLLKTDSNRR
jgi:hypothetical protein